MWDNSPIGKFQVELWLPPYIVEKIQQRREARWIHLFIQANVPKEEAGYLAFNYINGNVPEFFLDGELVPEDVENFKEVESRLETGL